MSDFITKDSGVREEFDSGMVRDTEEGKPRFDLLFPIDIPYKQQLLTRFADLMARGAVKYGERNWEKANSLEELDRARSSAIRHFMQWMNDEKDEDHAAAVLFNIMAAEAIEQKIGNPVPSLRCTARCFSGVQCALSVHPTDIEHQHGSNEVDCDMSGTFTARKPDE